MGIQLSAIALFTLSNAYAATLKNRQPEGRRFHPAFTNFARLPTAFVTPLLVSGDSENAKQRQKQIDKIQI